MCSGDSRDSFSGSKVVGGGSGGGEGSGADSGADFAVIGGGGTLTRACWCRPHAASQRQEQTTTPIMVRGTTAEAFCLCLLPGPWPDRCNRPCAPVSPPPCAALWWSGNGPPGQPRCSNSGQSPLFPSPGARRRGPLPCSPVRKRLPPCGRSWSWYLCENLGVKSLTRDLRKPGSAIISCQ